MRSISFLGLILAIHSFAFGQLEESDTTAVEIVIPDTVAPCNCPQCPGLDPSFPGGETKLLEYVRTYDDNYSPEMLELNLSGFVYVEFVVEPGGSITNVKVVKGLHEVYDKKAIEIVSNMPHWIPGTNECGNKIRVRYTVPIKFQSK